MSNRTEYSIYINVNWESRTQDLVRPGGQLSRCWKQWRRAEYSISNSIYMVHNNDSNRRGYRREVNKRE